MKRFTILALVAALGLGGVAAAQDIPKSMRGVQAKQLFSAKKRASQQSARAFGSYSRGCLAGGVQLPETGPTWQAMRLSRNRNWGHPEMIDFIKTLSAKAAQMPGWKGLYIGDIGQPRGGPVTGHRSHQLGLDVDIWMRAPQRLNLTRAQRESISSVSLRRAKGAYTNDNWTRQHFELLKAAAQDPRVARILVFPGAKVRMCKEATGNREWLRKIRPWWGHHAHFHVRLKCPEGVRGCVDQDPPPPGDGCEGAEQWVRDILNPPPPDPNAPPPKKRRELTMANLPQQCVGVLQSR